MNRKQRRQMGTRAQAQRDPVYSLKQSDIEKIKKQASEEAIQSAMLLLFAVPVKVMHDAYRWGPKRLPEFAEKLTEEWAEFENGAMSLEEYAAFVYETTGIKFEKTEDGNEG